MWKIIIYAVIQSLLLVSGQVFLKLSLVRMLPFGWNRAFWCSVFLNWRFALCGILFASASLVWMWIIKHFPLSVAYPMVSMSYVLGMLAAVLIFRENVSLVKWVGVALIITGCCLIAG